MAGKKKPRGSAPGLTFTGSQASAFALLFLGGATALALQFPYPSIVQAYLFKTLLALGAATVVVRLTGSLQVTVKNAGVVRGLQATGAMAAFSLVFLTLPAADCEKKTTAPVPVEHGGNVLRTSSPNPPR